MSRNALASGSRVRETIEFRTGRERVPADVFGCAKTSAITLPDATIEVCEEHPQTRLHEKAFESYGTSRLKYLIEKNQIGRGDLSIGHLFNWQELDVKPPLFETDASVNTADLAVQFRSSSRQRLGPPSRTSFLIVLGAADKIGPPSGRPVSSSRASSPY